jgi:hypothetical protein
MILGYVNQQSDGCMHIKYQLATIHTSNETGSDTMLQAL